MASFDLLDGTGGSYTQPDVLNDSGIPKISTASPTSSPSIGAPPNEGTSPNVYGGTTGGAANGNDPYGAVSSYYQQLLGRAPENTGVVQNWLTGSGNNLPNIYQGIFNSPESAAYRKATQPATPPTGTGGATGSVQDFIRNWQQTHPASEGIGPLAQALSAAGYSGVSRYMYGQVPSNNELMLNGQKFKVLGAEDNPATAYWYTGGNDSPTTTSGGTDWASILSGLSSGGSSAAVQSPQTNVFNDPATQQYEQLINQMMGRLNTPYQAPDLQPALDYMKQYFQSLQGPTYTPQQMDLMQTQALDPQTAQRDAARQQITEHLAAQGIGPSSGIAQSALMNSDQNYSKLRTTTQAGFANNAVALDQQRKREAASVGAQIPALEQAQQSANEGRQMQATTLGGVVPQLAWNRITGANSMIQPIETGSLLQQLTNAQNTSYSNSAGYSLAIMQLLTQLMGG